LPRCAPRLRYPTGLSALCAGGPCPWSEGDHRTGSEPYFRPARLVSGSPARQSQLAQTALLCLELYGCEVRWDAHYLSGYGKVQLDLGSHGWGVLLASLFLAPARSQLRQPPGLARRVSHYALLARHGRGWLPPGRGTLPVRARGDD